jgi:hypothetical protein
MRQSRLVTYTHQKILCLSVAYPDPDQYVYLNADSNPDPGSQTIQVRLCRYK